MTTPEVILIALASLSFGLNLVLHGADSKINFFGCCIRITISFSLMYWAGLFQ